MAYSPVGGVSADFDNPVTINGKTGAFVNYYQSLYNLVKPTSWFVEDGSFIRLRDESRANANVVVPGSLINSTSAKVLPCFIYYNYVDYWMCHKMSWTLMAQKPARAPIKIKSYLQESL